MLTSESKLHLANLRQLLTKSSMQTNKSSTSIFTLSLIFSAISNMALIIGFKS